MKERIVTISQDYTNAKEVANALRGKIYRDASNLHLALTQLLKKDEDDEPEEPNIYTLDNFLTAINEDTIGLDGYFVTKISFEL